jgi:hypothetical protein
MDRFSGLEISDSKKFMKIKAHLTTFASIFVFYSAFGQGALTPPGAPAPMMKSLDQVEPRTPVDAVHTPGNGSALFIISQPGSYYLTTNIFGVSDKDGVQIIANNVTLDLNGFSLIGTPNANNGIYVPNGPGPDLIAYKNIKVGNGAISGWSKMGSAGILAAGRNVTCEHLTVSANDYGIFSLGNAGGGAAVIRNCSINGNNRNGIHIAASDCFIVRNSLIGNNTANDSASAAIAIIGSNNQVDGNHVSGSGVLGKGVSIDFSTGSRSNNIVIRNFVGGGGANNYSFPPSGAIVGPLITNTASSIVTNSNPWANFSF